MRCSSTVTLATVAQSLGQKLISGHHVIQQRRERVGEEEAGIGWVQKLRGPSGKVKAVPGSLSSMHQEPIVLLFFSLKFGITQRQP